MAPPRPGNSSDAGPWRQIPTSPASSPRGLGAGKRSGSLGHGQRPLAACYFVQEGIQVGRIGDMEEGPMTSMESQVEQRGRQGRHLAQAELQPGSETPEHIAGVVVSVA